MCLAVPSRIVAIDGVTATVETCGERRHVNLMLLDDEVAVGDYLLIQAGGFAFERIDAQRAEQSLRLMREIVAQGEADIRVW